MLTRLSDESIKEAYQKVELEWAASGFLLLMFESVAQAALEDTVRQVAEWGTEWCPHQVGQIKELKRTCAVCWQELWQELIGGK